VPYASLAIKVQSDLRYQSKCVRGRMAVGQVLIEMPASVSNEDRSRRMARRIGLALELKCRLVNADDLPRASASRSGNRTRLVARADSKLVGPGTAAPRGNSPLPEAEGPAGSAGCPAKES